MAENEKNTRTAQADPIAQHFHKSRHITQVALFRNYRPMVMAKEINAWLRKMQEQHPDFRLDRIQYGASPETAGMTEYSAMVTYSLLLSTLEAMEALDANKVNETKEK